MVAHLTKRPLQKVVAEIDRHRPDRINRIISSNPELGRRVVPGSFRQDQLGGFVAQAQQLLGAKAVSLPG